MLPEVRHVTPSEDMDRIDSGVVAGMLQRILDPEPTRRGPDRERQVAANRTPQPLVAALRIMLMCALPTFMTSCSERAADKPSDRSASELSADDDSDSSSSGEDSSDSSDAMPPGQ
jgi:hypothetical protein